MNRCFLQVSDRTANSPLLNWITVHRRVVEGLIPDFVFPPDTCILYTTLNTFVLQPERLCESMAALKYKYANCLLLALAEDEAGTQGLCELNYHCLTQGFTLICLSSLHEAGLYLEAIGKSHQELHRTSSSAQANVEHPTQVYATMSTVKNICREDVLTLRRSFHSLSHVLKADRNELVSLTGIGSAKVQSIARACHSLFLPIKPTG